VSQKNQTRILWSITFANIGQYQCNLTELFVQQYLIIYHKNYSHRRVPAATVTMATSTLVQTNVCAITSRLPIVHVPPSSICGKSQLFLISPDVWPPNSPDLNPVDYKIWGCLQDRIYQKRIRNVNKLKQHLVHVWSDFWQTVTDEAIDEWRMRLQACMKGRHFEYVL